MNDAIIISDLHLGSNVCQAKKILKFLNLIQIKELNTKLLILNGDVFDSWDFRKLCKQQWKILSNLRKLSDETKIIWINGNHDGPAEIVSHLIGIDVMEEFIFTSGDKKILALHGHIFDNFISDHPIFTFLADYVYRWLQRIQIYWARNAKKFSKTFLRCSAKIEQEARKYAAVKKCQIVCVGHTHLAKVSCQEGIEYLNSGCWTELPCSYVVIKNGEATLSYF